MSIQRKSTPVATVSFAIKLDASIKDAPQAGWFSESSFLTLFSNTFVSGSPSVLQQSAVLLSR